jgi:Uma2 family endonuclease
MEDRLGPIPSAADVAADPSHELVRCFAASAAMAVIQALTKLLHPAAAAGTLRIQGPLAASETSEPEPDVAIAGPIDASAHPGTASLVVEVAVSAHREAQMKIPVYASARVDEYWIVDVPARTVQVHDHPRGDAYERTRTLHGDDILTVAAIDVSFTVAELFAVATLA